jgi:Amt family ammonium transporter
MQRSIDRDCCEFFLPLVAAMSLLLAGLSASEVRAQEAPVPETPEEEAAELAATTAEPLTLEAVNTKADAAALASHNAWMLTSSALVLFMTAPGLAMFLGRFSA